MRKPLIETERTALGIVWVVFGLLALTSFLWPDFSAIPREPGAAKDLYLWRNQLGQVGFGTVAPVIEATIGTDQPTIDRIRPLLSVTFAVAWLLCGALTIAALKPPLWFGLVLSYIGTLGAIFTDQGFLVLIFIVTLMQAHRVIWCSRSIAPIDTLDAGT